jgi:hypothetical protein
MMQSDQPDTVYYRPSGWGEDSDSLLTVVLNLNKCASVPILDHVFNAQTFTVNQLVFFNGREVSLWVKSRGQSVIFA